MIVVENIFIYSAIREYSHAFSSSIVNVGDIVNLGDAVELEGGVGLGDVVVDLGE